MIDPKNLEFYCTTCEGALNFDELEQVEDSEVYVLFTDGVDDWQSLVCPECGDTTLEIGVKVE